MNIYEKLQSARVELGQTDIKKSGKNTFSNYDYFELTDFLPHINRLMQKYKFTGLVTFTQDTARLVLVDCEKPGDQIEFTSPMSSASLKGCHEVQNLGAVQTYERRYLYMTAFEICESDALDKMHDKKEPPRNTEERAITKSVQKAENKAEVDDTCPACGRPISKAEHDFSVQRYGRPMCRACQKNG